MYTILGASGHIGGIITKALLENGKKVTVVARDIKKLREFTEQGAKPQIGPFDDERFLMSAFKGSTAVFAMIPPNLAAEKLRVYQNQVGEAISTAIKNTGVKYVVNLSSMGAHRPDKNGPVGGLYDQEQRLNKLKNINIVHLRPTFFMENLMGSIPMIKNAGINGSALKADLLFPIIATRDIGKYAASLSMGSRYKLCCRARSESCTND